MQHEDLFPDEFPLEELLLPDDDSEDLTGQDLLQPEPIPPEKEEPSEPESAADDYGQPVPEEEEPEAEEPDPYISQPVFRNIPAASSRFFGDIPLGPEGDTAEDPEDDDDFELFPGIAGKLSDFRASRQEEIPAQPEPEYEPEKSEPAGENLFDEPDAEPIEVPEFDLPEEAADPDPVGEEEYEPLPIGPAAAENPKPQKQSSRHEPADQPPAGKRSAFDIPMGDEDADIEEPEDDNDFELFSGIAGILKKIRQPRQKINTEKPEPESEPETVSEEAPDEPEPEPAAEPEDEPEYEPIPNEIDAPVIPPAAEEEIPEETSVSAESPAPRVRSVFDIPMGPEDDLIEDPEDDDDFELFSGIAGRLSDFYAPPQQDIPEPQEPESEAEILPDEPEPAEEEPHNPPEPLKSESEEDLLDEWDLEPFRLPAAEPERSEVPEFEPLPIAHTEPAALKSLTEEEPPEENFEPEPADQPPVRRRSFFDIPMEEDGASGAEPDDDDDFELFSGIAGSLNDFYAPPQPIVPEPEKPEPAPEDTPPEEQEEELLPLTSQKFKFPEVPEEPEEQNNSQENVPEPQSAEADTRETDEEDSEDEENENEDESDEDESAAKQPRLLGWFFRKKPGEKAESIVVEEAEEPETSAEPAPEIPVPPEYKAPTPVIIHSVPLDVEPEDDGSPISLMPDVEGSISDFIPPKKDELIDFSDEDLPEDVAQVIAEEAESDESDSEEQSSEEPDEESEKKEPSEDDEPESDEEADEDSDESGDDESADEAGESETGEKKKHPGLLERLKKGTKHIFEDDSESDEDESGSGKDAEEEPEEETQGFLQKAPLADVPPRQLASIFGAGLRLMRVRVFAGLFLCLPLIYLNLADSLNLPIYLVMWDDSFASLTMLELLAIILVLNFDTLINGVLDPFRGNTSLASIPVYAALFTLADCAVYALIGRSGPYPCAAAAGLAVAMTGLGHYYQRMGDRSTCRAAAMSSTPERISRQREDGEITDVLLKCGGGTRQFGSQAKESDGTQQLIGSVGLIILLAGIALAGVSILNGGNTMSFFWFASVILTAASPLACTLAYAMPYRRISARLAQGGAAIAGWKGVIELNSVSEIVLNDSDFFPSGMVKCGAPKAYGDASPEEVLGYAATLIHMGGCGVDSTFAEQVFSRGAAYHFDELTDFRIYEDGGYGGRFGDKEVIVGTAELMDSLEIPISRKQASRTALFCAIDGELAAHFNLNYTLPSYVIPSMQVMDRAKIKGILATRDFNLSPENLKKVYGIPVGKLRIAEIDERIDLTPDDSPAGTDLGALLCREGIDSHIDTIIGAKRLYRSARKSARWLAATAVVGMALGAYLTIMHAYTALEPINLLIFLVLWSLPPIIQGTQADKY